MGILTRVTRLCKADLHGVLDQLEDRGLVLKQCLRDMETEIDRKEARLRQVTLSTDQSRLDCEAKARELEGLEEDLSAALEKDRDDIARVLIRRIKPLQTYRNQLKHHLETREQEIRELREVLDVQKTQYDSFRLKVNQYCRRADREEKEAVLWAAGPPASYREPCEEEVELELFRRKDKLRGGGQL